MRQVKGKKNMKCRVLVIDGQGGNLGCQLIKLMKEQLSDIEIHAVGTNSSATANMLKNSGVMGATGENAVVVGCRKADIIVGPMGIVIADALMGEITSEMAKAVGQSSAMRVLVPVNRCDTLVAGVANGSMTFLLQDAVDKIKGLIAL